MSDQPFTEHVELEHGGDLYLTHFADGGFSFAVERDGTRFSDRLTVKDVRALRLAVGGVLLDHYVSEVRA